MTVENLIFIGLNGRVATLDRRSGEIVWEWKCAHSSGYVSLLVDHGRLIVSVNGYTHCLDPLTGEQFWENTLKGFGTGPAAIATVNAHTPTMLSAAAAQDAANAAAASAAAVSTTT